jgi:hypothetical protein
MTLTPWPRCSAAFDSRNIAEVDAAPSVEDLRGKL